jgi:DNA (cytosine-5)-methyltransferase 1
MRIGSLFSGAGGLDMAVEHVFGGTVVWHSEIDKAASKVLAHRYPDVPNLGDITEIHWATAEKIDVLCGGFPCQDVSMAAVDRRKGLTAGTRSGLWSEFAAAIDWLMPSYVVIENVRGLLSATADRNVESEQSDLGNGAGRPVLRAAGAVCGDLADLGYDAQWTTLAASGVGAPHKRERVFFIACRRGVKLDDLSGAGGVPEFFDVTGKLLPTPNSQDGGRGPRSQHSLDFGGHQTNLNDICKLLPTPRASEPGSASSHSGEGFSPSLGEIARKLLPTPSASDGLGGGHNNPANRRAGGHSVQLIDLGMFPEEWGVYSEAIRRWENITRPAPPPTEIGKTGNPRLSARLSEWMMGWPDGWVTDIDLKREDHLRICGNGVVPQQAAAALRSLVRVSAVAG